jgi:hypothetical protein
MLTSSGRLSQNVTAVLRGLLASRHAQSVQVVAVPQRLELFFIASCSDAMRIALADLRQKT